MKKKIQKPFDVEAAKDGAKVETRDGQPVRILCYDREDINYPIVALINRLNIELCATYDYKGRIHHNKTTDSDLVIVEEVEVSKFNVGDWIFKSECPLLVTAVNSGFYRIQDRQGYTAEINQRAIDKFYHLWTIGDARPGDILISEKCKHPFIFKALDNKDRPIAYCGIDCSGSIYINAERIWTISPVRPATYKERQQLGNKLEEEGYKWDGRTLTLWKKCN